MYLVLLALNVAALPLLLILLRKAPPRGTRAFTLALLPLALLEAVYTLLDFGGAFGPGALLFCLAFPLVLVSGVVYLIARIRLRPKLREDRELRRAFAFGGVAVLLLQAAPIWGNFGIGGLCDARITGVGDSVVAAVRSYQSDHGADPERLEALVPAYLPVLPHVQCFGFWGPETDFGLQRCTPGPLLLTAASADGSQILRYNFDTGNWSGISFLDGACNYLR